MEKKTSKNILLAIMGILILVEIVVSIITVNAENIAFTFCVVIPMVFIALYGFWLYKKPHGNLLKYAMLLVAASEIFLAVECIQFNYNALYLNVIWLFLAAILVYVAGRLNRIEQNKYLLAFVAIAQFVRDLADVFSSGGVASPLRLISWFSCDVAIITLMIAYFVRFKEHKEAGLADAPKK